ncbi:MAG: acyl carrier protein [Deltaproteobacteria bacterium]|nr:acyl carrier protein [Deltaproteobacteria bacterium]
MKLVPRGIVVQGPWSAPPQPEQLTEMPSSEREMPPDPAYPHRLMEDASDAQRGLRIEGVIESVRSSQQLAAEEPLDAETFLLERGLALDSVSLLDLVLALEERFGLRIAEDDVVAENFETIARVAELIDRIATDA